MTLLDIEGIINDTQCEINGMPWRITCGYMGDGFYVQLRYDEPDIETGVMEEQHARKWYLSSFSCKSEVVQTILKACLTSAEHMIREHFIYRGARIYGPHFSVDKLADDINQGWLTQEYRDAKPTE